MTAVYPLTALRNPVAGVIDVNGTHHNVLKPNGLQYQEIDALNATTPVARLYDLTRQLVPTLPESELMQFDKDMCGHVLVIASQGVQAVERAFPNADSPDGGSTSPG